MLGLCDAEVKISLNALGADVSYLNFVKPANGIFQGSSTIELTTPPDDSLLGPQLGRLVLYLKSDGQVLLQQDFTITLNEPDCERLLLNPISLEDVTTAFGDPEPTQIQLPALTDQAGIGIFDLGYCPYYFEMAWDDPGSGSAVTSGSDTDTESEIINDIMTHVTIDGLQLTVASPEVHRPFATGTLQAKLTGNFPVTPAPINTVELVNFIMELP